MGRENLSFSVGKLICICSIFLATTSYVHSEDISAKAQSLRCEHLTNPMGVERWQPRLSWQMQPIAGRNHQEVTAWRILVAGSRDLLSADRGDLWDSGKVTGRQPVQVAYGGVPLQSLKSCFWKVKLWDEKGQELPWSVPSHWSMGILSESEWQGEWIGYTPPAVIDLLRAESFDKARWIWHAEDDPKQPPAETRQLSRKVMMENPDELESAEMILTANDAFRLSVNGRWLTTEKIVFDGADDVPRFSLKPFLRPGENTITVIAEKRKPTFAHVSIRPVAGIIGVMKWKRTGQQVETLVTDGRWMTRKSDADDWTAARDLGPANSHWRHMPGWRQDYPSPILRKTFHLSRKPHDAKIAISGLGYYELYCNGRRVGDHQLDPVFTNYDHRVSYVCYDLTDLLRQGENVLAVMLGNGWYNMHTRATWNFDKAPWRDQPKMRAQLHVSFADGTQEKVVSDTTWRGATGPVILDGIHNGEVYDARLEREGWREAGFDDRSWPQACVRKAPKGKLSAQIMPAIRIQETVVPVGIAEPDPGVYVVDMGKNMAGWVRIQVSGPAGKQIRLRFDERLDSRGRVNQGSNSRYMFQGPFQTDTYILKGKGTEVWEPRFTHHGFRYVEITGWPGRPTGEQVQGRVVHTAYERTGSFECSHPLLNRIAALTDNSYGSNFVGYPTDCPQREKNGWTGDAHLAMEQAMFNYRNTAAYESFCRELHDSRTPEGDLPGIVPTGGWGFHSDNGPGWGSAAVIMPWYLYLYTGDRQILADHYPMMHEYVDFLDKRFPDHVVEMCRGDWVFLHTRTPPRVTSTALFYYDSHIVATAADLLQKPEDAARYHRLAEEIQAVYNRKFYRGEGVYEPGGQTSQAISLYYGLTPEKEIAPTAAALAAAVHRANDHIDCGFLGMKALFQALSGNGLHSLAFTVATQPDFPGYGDWISRGATTLWEDWTDTEGSLNHIALGDIVTWFYRSLAGIQPDPDQPGFRHIKIRPRPVSGLTFVRVGIESGFGAIRCHWTVEKGLFRLEVVIPPNTTADVYLPNGEKHTVYSGRYSFSCPHEYSGRMGNNGIK